MNIWFRKSFSAFFVNEVIVKNKGLNENKFFIKVKSWEDGNTHTSFITVLIS